MEATSLPLPARAAPAPLEPAALGRRVGGLFVTTGLALFALMGVLGLLMRLTQAEVIGLGPSNFYQIMTLHGAGMLVAALLAQMGAMWFGLRDALPLSTGRALASYLAVVAGTLVVLVAVQIGGFAPGWTFLWPLPFLSAGEWESWATATFLVGLLLVGVGFKIFCIDVLARATGRYRGLAGALGLGVLRGRTENVPPPQVVGATVIALVGLTATAAGVVIIGALFGRLIEPDLQIDALWAKNVTFFFGHSYANLIIYLAVGGIYVLLPRYVGRPWKTTRPFVIAWLGTLVFVVGAYFHHLYMDFVQPAGLQAIGFISSAAAAVPVLVVTVYTGMTLVWGSRYRWTLASTLIYLGFAGWVIGGAGAVIDSLIPLNFRLHNTLWVPAHFHTYLLLGVMLWAMALAAHLLERAAGRPANRLLRIGSLALMLLGGYSLVAVWYVAGALGTPRRYAVQPFGTEDYSLAGGIAVFVFAAGFLLLLAAFADLGLAAVRRSRTGSPPPEDGPAGNPSPALESPTPATDMDPPAARVPLAALAAAGTAALVALLPPVVEASQTSVRWHHLGHAPLFLAGAALALAVASVPSVWARLRSRLPADLGLSLVVASPLVSLLVMTPRFYGAFDANPTAHFGFHLVFVVLGATTGLGASRLGRVPAWAAVALASGMGVLYSAGVLGS